MLYQAALEVARTVVGLQYAVMIAGCSCLRSLRLYHLVTLCWNMASCKLQTWRARSGSTRNGHNRLIFRQIPNLSLVTSSQPNCNIKFHSQSKIIAPKKAFPGRGILEASLEPWSHNTISITCIVTGKMTFLSMDKISHKLVFSTVSICNMLYIHVESRWQNIIIRWALHSCLCCVTLSTLSQVCHTDCKDLTSYFTGQDIARGETNTSEKVGYFGYPNEVPALKHARLPLEGNHPTHEILPFHGLPCSRVQRWRAFVANLCGVKQT